MRVQVIHCPKYLCLVILGNLDFPYVTSVYVCAVMGRDCWKSLESRTGLSRQGFGPARSRVIWTSINYFSPKEFTLNFVYTFPGDV